MEIELTTKTKEEIDEIMESFPKGHTEEKEDKIYWVFENEIEFGV